jgi:hypothetical protein
MAFLLADCRSWFAVVRRVSFPLHKDRGQVPVVKGEEEASPRSYSSGDHVGEFVGADHAFRLSGVSSLPARIGVRTTAGQRTLTPMPWSTSVAASYSVKPRSACLVTVYEEVSKITSRPAADAT